MPLTSAITAASVLALTLIMMVCTCIVCRTRRKLCFKGNKTIETRILIKHLIREDFKNVIMCSRTIL